MDLQKLSKPYFKIQPDYEGCLGYFSKDYCSYGCDDDTLELDGYESTPFVIHGIEDWCWEWDKENHFYKDHFLEGIKSDFDWSNWHKRGLDLAQRLRQITPDEIEIVYDKYDENIVLDKINYFYFSADTCGVVGDTNGCSEIYEDDILEVAHFLPIHLPRLDNWWKEYDRHVDYADSTADPDFDWATWYCKGLEMVKIIRKNLPLSVDVWFRIPYELRQVFPVPDLIVKGNGSFLIRDFLKRDKKSFSVAPQAPNYSKMRQVLDKKDWPDKPLHVSRPVHNVVNTECISIKKASRWIAAMVAADGLVSPKERKLLKEFADTYGLETKSLYRMAYAIAHNVDVPEVEFVTRREMLGRKFEDFVVSLCSDKSIFKLIAWRGDKITGEVYALENLLPDLHLRHRLDVGEVEYYIECKYRSSWSDNGIDLSGQYARYQNAAKHHKMELFIAIGVGGTPSNPDEFFLIPGRMIKLDKKIDRDRFIKCLCPKDTQGFHEYINHYFNRIVLKNR